MRVVIAEDSAVLRAGLVEVLVDRDHEVVSAVGDAETLLAAVAEHRPDVTVIDIRMPPTYTDEGLRAAVRLRSEMPEVGVLVFSQYIETRYTDQLLAGRTGGIGYLLKERVADVDEFIDALERIAVGGTALDPEVVRQWLGAGRRTDSLAALSPREYAVLALMAEGRTNSAVAQRLSVSDGAVEKHVGNIFAKLGLEKSCADNRRVLAVLRYLEGDT
ncbi:response regulator transcription factor [Actinomadura sp. HBU206391]|uniref:response regulator transcription factor n=1 Tax=Actinomadura sp. HBU206391 TaxID=2731692 RepID=UPI001650B978|nr:response regulator transcription factor [Actinomadura sp. HBU206391]MBC6457470.1 response regulator transcription factor [Actinomadura sp. HBU206391]